ncbi:Mannonate dehydratase [Mariniflexile rhizosphaerae]|uniref:mannonate dehydratase n=1 Tax=unclassified Mariniflexile TaxID=2643887 RepID=UPI000CAD4F4A|nr:mannonate dehydratase [Mariniflexile sp. TRM1-10]AXP82806.1 Mannonate dehydratase [Mariniflexile sp. TRM1-10]PLB19063.1 MAG: Mannonate dehydratase [Flavobacteriaceae bacterium FS1-H7996/R]
MQETFRWFGVNDSVKLSYIKQAGATGVVTALHHIPNGDVWEVDEILKVKNAIEAHDLEWSFIESIPIHESIKLRKGDYLQRIENYKQSLRNVAACGIKNVCYNFMPVLDWTRTELFWKLSDGSTALRFDKVDMAVFEKFIMEREGVEAAYTPEILEQAKVRFSKMTSEEKQALEDNVLKGLPGTVDDLTIPVFKDMIAQYDNLSHADLKANLSFFLNQVIPVCEEHGIVMAIHPDDPPMDIMGLPRIIKSEKDLEDLIGFIDSPSNGITFCTGSLGANPDNDLPKMIRKFADRIHFLHLRNVKREADGSFYEDNHLEGSSDMYEVVKAVLEVEKKRDIQLPMRPDHGHQMLQDLEDNRAYAGYTAIGRLRGLAELRGLALGISRS